MKTKKSDYIIFKDNFMDEATSFNYGDLVEDSQLIELCEKLPLREEPTLLNIQNWVRSCESPLGKLNLVFKRIRGRGYQVLEPHEILPHVKKVTAHKVVKQMKSAKRNLGYCDTTKLSMEERNMLMRSKANFGTLAALVESGLKGGLIHNDTASALISETSRQLKQLEALTSEEK